jgi:hypothetical protein
MNADPIFQVQVKSAHDWIDLMETSTERNARQSADRYRDSHPERQYRIVRFEAAEVIEVEAACSCPQSDTYRQLVPTCARHGHESVAVNQLDQVG